MRIIAGKMKGAGLYMAKDKNTRPLKDLARESIFNLLKHSNKISFKFEKSNILDLYAGTGSFGLECASREAKSIFFVENEKEAIETLKKNIKKLKIEKKTKIFFDDVFNVIKKHDKTLFSWLPDLKLDLIFCDPPFKDTNISKLIELIVAKGLLKKNGIIILHRHKNTKERLTNYFKMIDERVYGISKITFGKLSLTSF